MTTTEGRKQTPRDVASNREAVLPKNSENPQESGRPLGQSISPIEKCHQTSGETLEDLEKRADNPKYVRWDKPIQLTREQRENLLTTSEPPPKTSETSKEKRTPKIGADPLSDFTDRIQLRNQRKKISKVLRYTL